MKEAFQGRLEKIDEFSFRIPRSYKPGMKVDGVIYSDEKMLAKILRDNAPEQVANVAFLPGIVKASLAMPDIHWGYGFCLTKDTKILTDFGFYRPIKDFEKNWRTHNLKSIGLDSKEVIKTPIVRFIKLKPKEVFKIVTKAGCVVKATGDHPLLTPLGMRPIKKLAHEEKVSMFPFQGVPYRKPSSARIISEKDIKGTLLKLGRIPNTPKFEIILQKLKNRNLLTLSYNHSKLPLILKIMGFVFGDGSMNFIGKRGDGILHFSGKPQDLEEVRKDLKEIGYTPGPIHSKRVRNSLDASKLHLCHFFNVNASSLVVLLETLGVPRGIKVSQPYRVPEWIFKAPLWQKRLFLASLFGCELRTPHRRLDRRGYFNAPVFPMAKREELITNGKDFLNDITRLLKEFGVRSMYIDKRRKHANKKGEISWALELIFSPKPENLLNLWGKVGFEYNSQRFFIANVATQYLKLKMRILEEKERVIDVAIPQLLKQGLSYQRVAFQLAGNPLTKRFIMDICWKLNQGKKVTPRIPASFPLFEDYLENATEGLGKSGMVWDKIEKIEKIVYNDFVYDFTVFHSDHNFIANNFVVSNCIGGIAATDIEAGGVVAPGGIGYDINCGVRLIRTSLKRSDVKDKIKDLVAALFNHVPTGVGSEGNIRLSQQEQKKMLTKGAKWAVEKGFGEEDDLIHSEENGCIEGTEPDVLSERALKRGKPQSGTLGSGNHFLEVQAVDEIYDRETAEKFGIEDVDQILVMIHTGSRGLGHQVCDDYVKSMYTCLAKYDIKVPDRELVCAPVNSDEGRDYLCAMRCAANYAWANRQILMHLVRESFEKFFNESWQKLGMDLIYDVAHNIAKIEEHEVQGEKLKLCVHRKGATRAFGPKHPALPGIYQETGQPVIVPGDMGRNSYLLAGTEKAMQETFGSTCHGAGRLKSRHAAKRTIDFSRLMDSLHKKGICVMARGRGTVVEEAPEAYKDVNDVVNVVHKAGISKKVCRMKPLGVIKG